MNYLFGASDFFRRPSTLLYYESALENYFWASHRKNLQAFLSQRQSSPPHLNDIWHRQVRKAREGRPLSPV